MDLAVYIVVISVLPISQVLKQNLFSVFLAADDREESEISFGERPDIFRCHFSAPK